jgi:3-deoxy-manno-octulosonate cytidylyltransferase (CMP-KDO synthetase)
MKILAIIPARYASTRFPGKPLVDIKQKSMIQRVYEQSCKCSLLDDVIIATDDDRIMQNIAEFGGKGIMTSPLHQSGTDRCAEVAAKYPDYDVVINVQGDEPYINPVQISKLISCFNADDTQIATLIKQIDEPADLHNVNSPKVVINNLSEAIYFSRSPLPHIRGQEPENWLQHYTYYKHIGIYGFRAEVLQQVTRLPIATLEKAESLEQLRWIQNGYRIKVAETELETQAVDTPEDLQRVLKTFD